MKLPLILIPRLPVSIGDAARDPSSRPERLGRYVDKIAHMDIQKIDIKGA